MDETHPLPDVDPGAFWPSIAAFIILLGCVVSGMALLSASVWSLKVVGSSHGRFFASLLALSYGLVILFIGILLFKKTGGFDD